MKKKYNTINYEKGIGTIDKTFNPMPWITLASSIAMIGLGLGIVA